MVREEDDILEYLDSFTRYLQLSDVSMSVRALLLALQLLPDIYKMAKALVAPQLIKSIPFGEVSSIL
jgi:hypothetical protein